jgi:hypothetical protein
MFFFFAEHVWTTAGTVEWSARTVAESTKPTGWPREFERPPEGHRFDGGKRPTGRSTLHSAVGLARQLQASALELQPDAAAARPNHGVPVAGPQSTA